MHRQVNLELTATAGTPPVLRAMPQHGQQIQANEMSDALFVAGREFAPELVERRFIYQNY